MGELFERAPTAVGQSLIALDMHAGPTQEVVVAAADTAGRDELVAELRSRFWPNRVTAAVPGQGTSTHLAPVLEGKRPLNGKPTLFICENFACQAPLSDRDKIEAALEKLAPAAH